MLGKSFFPAFYSELMAILDVEECSHMQQKDGSCFIILSGSLCFLLVIETTDTESSQQAVIVESCEFCVLVLSFPSFDLLVWTHLFLMFPWVCLTSSY